MPRTRRRPVGTKADPVRSLRCPDAVWEKAKRRAQYDGLTMSHVINLIVEGYGEGYLDLPKMQVVYRPAAVQEAQASAE